MRINDKENYDIIRNSISMTNLKKIIDSKQISMVKLAMNSKISDSTIKAYISGQKIPSLPTLVSIADYLNCNIDYLLDRTNNPIKIDDINSINKNEEINQLFQNIISLPNEKRNLVIGYVQGLLKQ